MLPILQVLLLSNKNRCRVMHLSRLTLSLRLLLILLLIQILYTAWINSAKLQRENSLNHHQEPGHSSHGLARPPRMTDFVSLHTPKDDNTVIAARTHSTR